MRWRLARAWWWVREFTGETAYDRYTARLRASDPAAAPLPRREFERRRVEERYAADGGGLKGCC